eukprot:SAG22_NODE_3602_length_1622_cov_1.889691_2_plen_96_part_00
MVQEVKRVPKLCADASIGAYVAAKDRRGCFAACSAADQKNLSSPCNINCFFDTLLGPSNQNATNGTGGLALADALTAWRRPFESSDAAKGGCPSI